jgi:hypothetical protein
MHIIYYLFFFLHEILDQTHLNLICLIHQNLLNLIDLLPFRKNIFKLLKSIVYNLYITYKTFAVPKLIC